MAGGQFKSGMDIEYAPGETMRLDGMHELNQGLLITLREDPQLVNNER